MLVKTLHGKYGRINTRIKGGLKLPVTILNDNLFTKYKNGKPVIEYLKPYELIYRPKVIVKL